LNLTADALPSLTKTATGTPFEKLVAAIGEDLKHQTQRDDDVDALAKRIVGKDAPEFSLQDLSGKTVDSKNLAGEIVVLHFWKYHDNPLTEPYGQVAYLDFLHNKRQKLGVSVLGIAVDARNENPAEVNNAKRDFRKFRDFMNLSYPIALNAGTLLKSLGDPRTVEAPLPLWVVIDHKGKVVHYKSGYYEIHPDKGLEELDNVVIPLIRERRADKIKSAE
jgi:peroxiredoxin